MVEYINKEEAYRTLNSLYNDLESLDEEDPELWVDGFIGVAIDKIDDIPAADVAPVKHGEWMVIDDTGFYKYYLCNQCNEVVTLRTRYCPNCGAKMDGKE